MVLFLNEWSKAHRYADSFDSFNKFLNKLLEDKKFVYLDLVDFGIEWSEEKSDKYILEDLYPEIRFYILEQFFKEVVAELVKTDFVPVIELRPLENAIDYFSREKELYLKMLMKSYFSTTVFCGSSYEFEHFKTSSLIDNDKQLLYSGETTFFLDVEDVIKKNIERETFEKVVSSVDGFGYYFGDIRAEDVTNATSKEVVSIAGSIGTKLSFEDFIAWLTKNRKKIQEENGSFRLPNTVFVRKHHPVELFLK